MLPRKPGCDGLPDLSTVETTTAPAPEGVNVTSLLAPPAAKVSGPDPVIEPVALFVPPRTSGRSPVVRMLVSRAGTSAAISTFHPGAALTAPVPVWVRNFLVA